MECENIYCVYCKNNKCLLERITIDISGLCQECIYATIDNKILEKAKNEF